MKSEQTDGSELMITIFSMGTLSLWRSWLLMAMHSFSLTQRHQTNVGCNGLACFFLFFLNRVCGLKGFGHQVVCQDTFFVTVKLCWFLFSIGEAVLIYSSSSSVAIQCTVIIYNSPSLLWSLLETKHE